MTFSGRTFYNESARLDEYLEDIQEGTLQIPAFQRDWVWGNGDIVSLISSVSLSYPVGSILLLEGGTNGRIFPSRPVAGAPEVPDESARLLVLDGQQRLTALYLALRANPLQRDRKLRKGANSIYEIDMEAAVDPGIDRESAIHYRRLSKTYKRDVKTFHSTAGLADLGYESKKFPLHVMFEESSYNKWLYGYQQWHKNRDTEMILLDDFREKVLEPIRWYRFPTIVIPSSTAPETVCRMFETINDTGKKLTVFDLLTARFATKFDLGEDWKNTATSLHKFPVLRGLRDIDFIQAMSLFVTLSTKRDSGKGSVSCRREAILEVTPEQYQQCSELLVTGFVRAQEFLESQGVYSYGNVPYKTLIGPLAATFALIERYRTGQEVQWEAPLEQWFWLAVFGELYSGPTETIMARDVEDLANLVLDGQGELRSLDRVKSKRISAENVLTRDTKKGALFKGVMALLIREGCKDFVKGPFDFYSKESEDAINDHHIFPKAYCQAWKYGKALTNSIANRTPLTAGTNTRIGGKSPGTYISELASEPNLGEQNILDNCASHNLDISILRKDLFREFVVDRSLRLQELIRRVVGDVLIPWERSDIEAHYGVEGGDASTV